MVSSHGLPSLGDVVESAQINERNKLDAKKAREAQTQYKAKVNGKSKVIRNLHYRSGVNHKEAVIKRRGSLICLFSRYIKLECVFNMAKRFI